MPQEACIAIRWLAFAVLSVSFCGAQTIKTPVAEQNSDTVADWRSDPAKVRLEEVFKAGVDVTDPAPLPKGHVLRESLCSPCRLPGVQVWTTGGGWVSSSRTSGGLLIDRHCPMSSTSSWATEVPPVFWAF